MSPAIRAAVFGCILAALAPAQGFCPVATVDLFVPDNQSNVGTCNAIPFGSASYSYLGRIPASYMNAATPIVRDVAFAPCSSGTLTFATIQIVIGHVPNPLPTPFPFPTTNLSSIGGFLDATMVYDSTIHGTLTWPLTQDQWSPMNLPATFTWNGVDDVGFFITFLSGVSSGGFGGSMHRTNTEPVRCYTSGYAAATAATNGAASGLKMRLACDQTGTLFQTLATASAGGGGSLSVTNLPVGAVEGYTLLSAATTEPLCFGPMAGVYPDAMTWDVFLLNPTATVGNPLHFVASPPPPPPFYPSAPLFIPTGTLLPFVGQTWDVATIAFGPGFVYLGNSTVSRVTWL
jgi:hypothetical protein